jgi:cell division septum initiation protein DivIVA
MANDNDELLREVKRLRSEVQQLREVVNSLVTMVMEMEEFEDEHEPPFRPPEDNFSLLN